MSLSRLSFKDPELKAVTIQYSVVVKSIACGTECREYKSPHDQLISRRKFSIVFRESEPCYLYLNKLTPGLNDMTLRSYNFLTFLSITEMNLKT